MNMKLRNRKAAEAQLGQFVEDLSLPPKLISGILEADVRPPRRIYIDVRLTPFSSTRNT